jgi:hypothetical protein
VQSLLVCFPLPSPPRLFAGLLLRAGRTPSRLAHEDSIPRHCQSVLHYSHSSIHLSPLLPSLSFPFLSCLSSSSTPEGGVRRPPFTLLTASTTLSYLDAGHTAKLSQSTRRFSPSFSSLSLLLNFETGSSRRPLTPPRGYTISRASAAHREEAALLEDDWNPSFSSESCFSPSSAPSLFPFLPCARHHARSLHQRLTSILTAVSLDAPSTSSQPFSQRRKRRKHRFPPLPACQSLPGVLLRLLLVV